MRRKRREENMTHCRFPSVSLTSLPNILKVVHVQADVGASPVNIVRIRCNRADFKVERLVRSEGDFENILAALEWCNSGLCSERIFVAALNAFEVVL